MTFAHRRPRSYPNVYVSLQTGHFLSVLEADVHVLTRGRCCVATLARNPPFQSISAPARSSHRGPRHYNGADSPNAKESPCPHARWSIATPIPRFRTAMPRLRTTSALLPPPDAVSWSRPTTSPCLPAWTPTAKCRSSRATCQHIVWPLRTPASSPRRLRRSSPLSTVLNAIGTKVASLWLSAGPRVPLCAWAACTGLATPAISWPVPRVRRERKTSLAPIRPIPFAVGSTMTPTCTFGKT